MSGPKARFPGPLTCSAWHLCTGFSLQIHSQQPSSLLRFSLWFIILWQPEWPFKNMNQKSLSCLKTFNIFPKPLEQTTAWGIPHAGPLPPSPACLLTAVLSHPLQDTRPFFGLLLFSETGTCRLAPSWHPGLDSDVTPSVRIFLKDTLQVALLPQPLPYYLFCFLAGVY